MQRTKSVALFGCYDGVLSSFGSGDWRWAKVGREAVWRLCALQRPPQYYSRFEKIVRIKPTSLNLALWCCAKPRWCLRHK